MKKLLLLISFISIVVSCVNSPIRGFSDSIESNPSFFVSYTIDTPDGDCVVLYSYHKTVNPDKLFTTGFNYSGKTLGFATRDDFEYFEKYIKETTLNLTNTLDTIVVLRMEEGEPLYQVWEGEFYKRIWRYVPKTNKWSKDSLVMGRENSINAWFFAAARL